MLNQLVDYARKNLADSEPGFTTRNVRWLVDVSADGLLINVLPVGDDKGEQTPKCPDMHNMNAGGRAHFLVESLQTVSLYFKNNETEANIEKTRKRHDFYDEMLRMASADAVVLHPLSKFLQNHEQVDGLRKRFEDVRAKPSDWLRWSVAGVDPMKQVSVLEWWRLWRDADQKVEEKPKKSKKASAEPADSKSGDMICILTGRLSKPLLTHPKVGGLAGVGGLGTKDVMVGFDKSAFCSFGLDQAQNASMDENAARGYVDALEHLINNHSRKLASALVVHWFKNSIPPEDDPLSFLYEPPEQTEAAARGEARRLLEALRSGQRPMLSGNRYYALTLSGASGRVMVRDWMEGSFEELVDNIERWFADLETVAREGGHTARDPKFMAVCGALVRELKDLPAQTTTSLWRCALIGLPIPQPFLAQALVRFRSDLLDDKFNHARMGLIKAYFIRKGGNQNMTVYLNKEHPEAAYQCGRLLAVLASLQRAALGDVGAGVVQRYYVAASQTPGLTLGRLIANAKNHLSKLEGGLTYWYEGQISEIMSHIQDRIPTTLDLERQSLFALGYYQQIADNRAGKKNNATNDTNKGDN